MDPETRASLISRLEDSPSEAAWAEFVDLYQPLIYRVARGRGLQHTDAEDLAQDVLVTVSKAISSFDVDRNGSFRAWLKTITRNLAVNHLTRRKGPLASGDTSVQKLLQQEPESNDTARLFQLELRRQQFRQAAEHLKDEFSTTVWQSFWLTAVEQLSIDEAAERLGKSNGAVRVARCRVLARLRDYAATTDETE